MKINWKGICLWSNQFYGICAILLATASSLIILHQRPPLELLLFIHIATVLYYTHAYLNDEQEGVYNERTSWNQRHKKYLKSRQLVYLIICVYLALFKLNILYVFIQSPFSLKWALLFTTFISVLYYLPSNKIAPLGTYRNKGILKSMSIAWTWTMIACFIPIWLVAPNASVAIINSSSFWAHFVQLFLYILVLAILFDIKDLNRDKEELVKTIVVKYGVAHTIQKIIVPLLLIYFIASLFDYHGQGYFYIYMLVQCCIVGITYIVSKKVVHQTAIHTNILMIDGLMIFKAILSITLLQLFIH